MIHGAARELVRPDRGSEQGDDLEELDRAVLGDEPAVPAVAGEAGDEPGGDDGERPRDDGEHEGVRRRRRPVAVPRRTIRGVPRLHV